MHWKNKKRGEKIYVKTEKIPFYDYNGTTIGLLAIEIEITNPNSLEKKSAQ